MEMTFPSEKMNVEEVLSSRKSRVMQTRTTHLIFRVLLSSPPCSRLFGRGGLISASHFNHDLNQQAGNLDLLLFFPARFKLVF